LSGNAARHKEPFLPFAWLSLKPVRNWAHRAHVFGPKPVHPHHQAEDPHPTLSSPVVVAGFEVETAVGVLVAALALGQVASPTRSLNPGDPKGSAPHENSTTLQTGDSRQGSGRCSPCVQSVQSQTQAIAPGQAASQTHWHSLTVPVILRWAGCCQPALTCR
jgi:hypothetical protein